MWDTWYVQQGETTHVYYLQTKIPNTKSKVPHTAIGHAISSDLLNWEELPGAIMPGDPNSPETAYDSGPLYTGSAVIHEGKFYNFYCGNHYCNYAENTPKNRQSMCLATSDDGTTFTKYEGNPIVEPTRGKYFNWFEELAPFQHHAHAWVDCRDMLVLKDPDNNGWLGYCVMRRKDAKDAFESSCIVLCKSDDLYHWTVGEPICTPNRFNCFEVPDVFQLDGRWFMLALTGNGYGQSERWTDKDLTGGTIVFESDSPVEPFIEVKDNLLLSDKHGAAQGYSARTVERNGERLMLFTRRCPGEFGNRLSWPVLLKRAGSNPGDGLNACYWSGCDKLFTKTRTSLHNIVIDKDKPHTIENANAHSAWMLFANSANFNTVTISLGSGLDSQPSYQILVNRKNKSVRLLDGSGKEITSRTLATLRGDLTSFRIVNDDGLIALYLNDILAVNHCLPEYKAGSVSLSLSTETLLAELMYSAAQ